VGHNTISYPKKGRASLEALPFFLLSAGRMVIYFMTYANETLPLRILQLARGIGRAGTFIDKVGDCQDSN